MEELPLDPDTAERLLSGQIAPDDAPPGYAALAALIRAAHQEAAGAEVPGEERAVGAMLAAMAAPQEWAAPPSSRKRRRGKGMRVRAAVVACVTVVASTSGLAAAGALPRGAQAVMSKVLGSVGLNVPDAETQLAVSTREEEAEDAPTTEVQARTQDPRPTTTAASPTSSSSTTTSSTSTTSTTVVSAAAGDPCAATDEVTGDSTTTTTEPDGESGSTTTSSSSTTSTSSSSTTTTTTTTTTQPPSSTTTTTEPDDGSTTTTTTPDGSSTTTTEPEVECDTEASSGETETATTVASPTGASTGQVRVSGKRDGAQPQDDTGGETVPEDDSGSSSP